jgi:hypothetical protein
MMSIYTTSTYLFMNNNNNNNHNSNNNNGGHHPNNSNQTPNNNFSLHHDWKDEVRETVTTVAQDVVEDARNLASEAREEVADLARDAKAKFDAIPPAKKMEINHWVSILVAVIIGLIIGLAVGWSRGHNKGILMQNGHMSSRDMMQQMSANLNGKSGRDLEQQFISDMIEHHEGAVDMATKLVGGPGVSNDALRAMAANIIRVQTEEIQQLKGMQE